MVRASRTNRRRAAPTNAGSSAGSVALMQPKLEAQAFTFDQPPPTLQTKIVPIAPRYDVGQPPSLPLPSTTNAVPHMCAHCAQPIHERQLLYTYDRLSRGNFWHMHCLRCQCCDVVLADVANTFYIKDNALLCKSDYIKRYGSRPCSLCSQVIGNNEQIMRVNPNYVYHLSCFTCMKCQIPLVKGDRYVLFNGQPFCEKDNPVKSTTNVAAGAPTKRAASTSRRGAKAARTAAAAAAVSTPATTSVHPQAAFGVPHQYHHTGHMSLLNNLHNSNSITHSLLSGNINTGNASSIAAANDDDLF